MELVANQRARADYRRLLERLPNAAVFILDRNLCVTTASGSIWTQSSVKPGVYCGKALHEILPPGAYAVAEPHLRRALDGLESGCEYSSPSGKTFQVYAQPLVSENSAVEEILVVALAATEQKRADDHLAPAALDGLSAHVAVVDHDGTILAVNHSWRSFAAANSSTQAGLGAGANYLDVCKAAQGPDSDEAPAFLTALLAVLSGDVTSTSVEYPCHSATEERWFVASVTRLPGPGPVRAVVSHENITRYKLMERALRDSEAHYRSLFENNYSVMLLVDGKGGAIVDANPAAVRYYGWARKELQSMRIGEINTLSAAEVQAEMNSAASEQRNYFMFKHRLADGSIRDVEVFSGPVSISDRSLLYSIVHDVTEHKRDEIERKRLLLQLSDQANRLALVMRSVPEGVLLLSIDRQVLLANPYAESLLALLATYTADSGAAKRLTHLGGAQLESLLAGPSSGQWHTLQAQQRTFEVVGRPVQSGEGDAGWVLVLRDVTAEHALQEQLQRQERLAAVGQLAAGIAHDFNNIMSVISIYAELLSEAPELSAKDRERAATISGQALRATGMIRQILDFSRRSVFERHTFDLLPLLKEQEKLLKQTLRENVEIELSYARGEYWVMADPTRIQQLVMNLAVNARDAMEQGGKLRLELDHVHIAADQWAAYPGIKPGKWVRLSVIDTGMGIAPEHLPRIFEPFFTTKETGKGTGLGLAQAHGIVAQHDGHILVASTPGAGTRFTIYLPAQEVAVAQPGRRHLQVAETGHGEHVLLVEDDEILRDTMADRLTHWNYRVTVAANGADALALIDRGDVQVDLIVSDVIMPRLGGVGLLKALRQKGATVPIILLSGHPRGEDPNDVESLGLCAWLTKPPQSDELASAMAKALGAL